MMLRALSSTLVCITMASSLAACLGAPVERVDGAGGTVVVPAAAPTPTQPEVAPPTREAAVDPAACAPSAEVCDGVDNDCNGRIDELDRCHGPELRCDTAPALGDPAREAWTTRVRSDALVVAPEGLGAVGEATLPAVYYRVALRDDSLLAVRTGQAVQVIAGACDGGRPEAPVERLGCGETSVAIYALAKGEYVLRLEGARTDAVDATVQAAPVPDQPGGYQLRRWDDLAAPFYVGVVASDPESRWVPPCGAGPRPWSVAAVYGCAAPSAVDVTVRGSSELRLASIDGDDAAVCVAPGAATLAVSPQAIMHRFAVSASGAGYGGVWVTAAPR